MKRILAVLGATLVLVGCADDAPAPVNTLAGEVTDVQCASESGFRYHREFTTITLDDMYGFEADSTYCTKLKVGSKVVVDYTEDMYVKSIKYAEEVSQE